MNRMKKGMAGSLIAGIILSVIVFLMIFFVVIFKNNLNSVLHNLRTEVYMISQNSIFALERDLVAKDIYSVYESDIEKFIKEEIRLEWKLDENLKNGQGIVKEANILDISLLDKGDVDNVTNKTVESMTIHVLIEVHVKQMILKSIFTDDMIFKMHEDVRVKKLAGV